MKFLSCIKPNFIEWFLHLFSFFFTSLTIFRLARLPYRIENEWFLYLDLISSWNFFDVFSIKLAFIVTLKIEWFWHLFSFFLTSFTIFPLARLPSRRIENRIEWFLYLLDLISPWNFFDVFSIKFAFIVTLKIEWFWHLFSFFLTSFTIFRLARLRILSWNRKMHWSLLEKRLKLLHIYFSRFFRLLRLKNASLITDDFLQYRIENRNSFKKQRAREMEMGIRSR